MQQHNISDNFDKALTNVITSLYLNNAPVAFSDKEIVIGNVIIKKEDNFYNIYDNFNNKLYTDIFLIESALIISRCYNDKTYSKLKDAILLDNKYTKHYLDMKIYLHTIKENSKSGHYDKAEVAKIRYRNSKDETVRIRCKVKSQSDRIIKNR